MPGLDPGITLGVGTLRRGVVDCWVKPGNDNRFATLLACYRAVSPKSHARVAGCPTETSRKWMIGVS
jgi:hypothetical protein